jgi:hypothetical protein
MSSLKRLIRCLAVVGSLGTVANCSSPTDPGACHDGRDGLGRGPVVFYVMTCAYMGSDTIQCASERRETGYCADMTRRDVTVTTQWLSSDPAAATFVSPGVLRITASGQVQVIAKIGFDEASGDYVYLVAPGTTPERLLKLLVIVRDAANADRRLVGAAVQVEPDRGVMQTCLTSTTGHCNFWVFDGRTRVRASLQEYESSAVLATTPAGGFTMLATLDLPRVR